VIVGENDVVLCAVVRFAALYVTVVFEAGEDSVDVESDVVVPPPLTASEMVTGFPFTSE